MRNEPYLYHCPHCGEMREGCYPYCGRPSCELKHRERVCGTHCSICGSDVTLPGHDGDACTTALQAQLWRLRKGSHA
jgi:hypothetical protein